MLHSDSVHLHFQYRLLEGREALVSIINVKHENRMHRISFVIQVTVLISSASLKYCTP